MNQNRKIILIFGRTGSGKSYLTKRLIKKIDRVCIIDVLFEYDNGLIFYTLSDFLDYLEKKTEKKFCYIFRFTSDFEIELLFDLLYTLSNLTLVVEEAEIYISSYSKKSNFLKLVRYGRHKSISIIAVARRVTELSNDLRAQANKIISFKQILKNDLDYLKTLGFHKVETLKQFDFETVIY